MGLVESKASRGMNPPDRSANVLMAWSVGSDGSPSEKYGLMWIFDSWRNGRIPRISVLMMGNAERWSSWPITAQPSSASFARAPVTMVAYLVESGRSTG